MSSHDTPAPAPAPVGDAALAAPPDDRNEAIADARMTLRIICGAIVAWAAIVYVFIL